MTQKEVIKLREKGHEKLKKAISGLTKKEMAQAKILGSWTARDIVAHLAAWNWRFMEEIDAILNNDAAWVGLSDKEQDEFNEKEIEKRKRKSLKEILEEWDKSSQFVIKKIQQLTLKEWNHQSKKDVWEDGSPLTVKSLFSYQYKGEGHEGGHANQIIAFFKKS